MEAGACPVLAPLVTVDAPLAEGGVWIIARDGVPEARVSPDVAMAARCFTGERSVGEIASMLGEPWTPLEIGQIAQRLAAAGLLVGARVEARSRRRRLRFTPPLTVQWDFGDPSSLFAALRPLTRFATAAPGLITALIVFGAGVVAAVSGGADIIRVLERPVPLSSVAGIGVALVLITVLHEFGHGVALSNFGGSPRRLGAMLFYLAPAFFCDVTDGWRLSRRSQRVVVALAGPAVHLLVAAVSVVLSRFVADPEWHAGLVLFALSCLSIGVLNLIPLVQLDGYLALMAALDMPGLRQRAMKEAALVIGSVFLGAAGPSVGDRAQRRWLVPYGVLCQLFPVGLVGFVLYRYATSIAGTGVFPALAYLAMLSLVAWVAVRTLWRGFRSVMARRPSALRSSLSLGAGAAALGAFLLLVPFSPSQHVGFSAADGRVSLVAANSRELPAPGTRVTLESAGLLASRVVGAAVVAPSEPRHEEVGLQAFLPVSASGLTAPGSTVPLVDVETSGVLPVAGRARFEGPDAQTVGSWLWDTFVARPFGALGLAERR